MPSSFSSSSSYVFNRPFSLLNSSYVRFWQILSLFLLQLSLLFFFERERRTIKYVQEVHSVWEKKAKEVAALAALVDD